MIPSNSPVKILFAEDLPTDAEMARREIIKGGIDFIYKVVETEPGFKKELVDFKPDIVVSDYSMPTFDGMRALEITRQHSPLLPFIVLTGSMNEETAVACMKAGANDYVIKEQITRLPFAVAEALAKGRAKLESERMQKQLHENETMYRSLIENSGDAIYLLYEGKFEIINTEFSKMFGYSYEELNQPGFDFINLVDSGSKSIIEERRRKLLLGEKLSSRYEFTALLKNGEKREVEASVSYINFKGGIATQGIIRDISEKKKMIDDLVAAKEKAEESDRLKSAFLANMSHEIRTPMNGIMGFTELLKEPKLTGKEKKQYIKIIQKSGQRMLSTINDLIEISKIESGSLELKTSDVNVNEVLDYLYSFFKPETDNKALSFKLEKALPDEEVIVETDQEKLNGVLMNLIKNAIKYTHSGEIKLGYRETNSTLEFYIKDTGIGIEGKRQKVVFDRFVQADMSISKPYEGAGLGLSIAKAYVEMLGGKIWLHSEPAKGTEFFFSIPLIRKTVKNTHTNPVKSKITPDDISKNLTVLVAEDDSTGQIYISELLKEKCKKLIFAETGIEAIHLFTENPEINLVLMDMKMPVMDGYEATKQIKKINPDVVVIAQTAYALSGDKEIALKAGCDGYLSKPFTGKVLFELIQKHFG